MNIKSKFAPFAKAIKLCKLLTSAGGEVRFIGGCVRDIIVGREFNDIDIATDLLPDVVEDILRDNDIKCFSVGKEFGTISAIFDREQYEITTLRKDLNCDGRYAKVSFTNDWKEDAQRRDFTINALSCDLDGNVYDYFDGLNDLNNNIVRFIGDPNQRITEDYLRILRFFRFSAYFSKSIHNAGLMASKKQAVHLKNVSKTRVRSELSKIFIAPKGLEILSVMEQSGVLRRILPCDKLSIKLLESLYQIVDEFNYPINELLCLAVLFRSSNDKDYIDFSFSKNEKNFLETLINANITDWNLSSLKSYWQIYKQDFKEIVLVNLVNYDIDNVCKNELNRLFNIEIKDLPVTGDDLLALNVEPGEEIGQLLNIADQIWYKREFKVSKKEIIKELMEYIEEF